MEKEVAEMRVLIAEDEVKIGAGPAADCAGEKVSGRCGG